MSQIVENHFKKVTIDKYIVVKRQLAFAIMGGIGFFIISPFAISQIIECLVKRYFGVALFASFGYIVIGGFSLLFVAMGLFTVTTEIDLKARKVRIIRRNFRGQAATQEASIDQLCINAVRMGISDANPTPVWIIKAGFFFQNANGEDSDVAIWSKEVSKIEDRNAIMLELSRFFFPDRTTITEANIITNGNECYLLSDTEKDEVKKRWTQDDGAVDLDDLKPPQP